MAATFKAHAARKPRVVSPARLAYLQMRRAKAQARLAKCEVTDFTFDQWNMVKKQFANQCAYCLKKPYRLTRDHIVPLNKGGNHTYSNIVPACRSCNSSKGTLSLDEWMGSI